jgi:hypothetical protein
VGAVLHRDGAIKRLRPTARQTPEWSRAFARAANGINQEELAMRRLISLGRIISLAAGVLFAVAILAGVARSDAALASSLGQALTRSVIRIQNSAVGTLLANRIRRTFEPHSPKARNAPAASPDVWLCPTGRWAVTGRGGVAQTANRSVGADAGLKRGGGQSGIALAERVGRNKRSALRRPADVAPVESRIEMAQ